METKVLSAVVPMHWQVTSSLCASVSTSHLLIYLPYLSFKASSQTFAFNLYLQKSGLSSLGQKLPQYIEKKIYSSWETPDTTLIKKATNKI